MYKTARDTAIQHQSSLLNLDTSNGESEALKETTPDAKQIEYAK